MNRSDPVTYQLAVSINGPLAEFCHLIIFNGFDEIVFRQYGNALIALEKGLYRVRIELNEERKEEMVRLDKNTDLLIDPPPVYSSIVAGQYNSSHEYYSHEASHWSMHPTTSVQSGGNQGSIFIFFRYPSREVRAEIKTDSSSLGKDFYLLNE